ncbi:MAG TPA: ABC transporter ATP-binding protein [Nitriliruptorales bacterium]
MSATVQVAGLTKRYDDVQALCGVDLSVERGEIFALLGPNGAGKTTLSEILAGLRRRDEGTVSVLGCDPERGGPALRRRLGIALQSTGIDPDIRVAEVLAHTARLYPSPVEVESLMDSLGLASRARAATRTLSGGERRRLDLALALVGTPELLILDEPTTGLDPVGRQQAWDAIRTARSVGTTVLVTTHALDEAARWADQVAVMIGGRVVETGSPEQLTAARATEIRFRLADPSGDVDTALRCILADCSVSSDNGRWQILTADPADVLRRLTGWAHRSGHPLNDLTVHRASLEDVYLDLVDESTAVAS